MFQPFSKFSFVRFTLFLILGILLYPTFSSNIGIITIVFILLFTFYCFFLIKLKDFKSTKSIISGVIAFILCFLCGILSTYRKDPLQNPDHFGHRLNSIDAYEAKLISPGKETSKTYSFTAEIKKIKQDTNWKSSSGKAILYIRKDEISESLSYGDHIMISGAINPAQRPKNPYQFNYAGYLKQKGILGQAFVDSTKWCVLKKKAGNIFFSSSYSTSNYLQQVIKKMIHDSSAQAIAMALSLGVKDDLNPELKQAYASAGAMHILAVSGLHVGIIYLLVSFSLKSLRTHKGRKWFYLIVCITTLWAFAFITGLSPSVLRASSMFSFIAIADCLNRKTNIYNTLASTAFIILLINPYFLFSVGFQLSYLAVLGIVFFQPRLYKIIYIKSKFWDKIWSLSCVSVAAQLGTLPLSLLYFKQFPSYFLIANLFAIPAAFIILIGCLILFSTSFLPYIAKIVGLVLSYIIQALNYLISSLQLLPYHTAKIAEISITETMLLYSATFFLALSLGLKKAYYYYLSALCLFIFSISLIFQNSQRYNKTEFVVFHDKVNLYAGIKEKGKLNLITIENEVNSTAFQYSIAPYFNYYDPEEDLTIPKDKLIKRVHGFVWFQLDDQVNVIWDKKIKHLPFKRAVSIDCLIIANDAVKNYTEIKSYFDPKEIILAANNSYFTIRELSRKFEAANVKHRIISKEGFIKKTTNELYQD